MQTLAASGSGGFTSYVGTAPKFQEHQGWVVTTSYERENMAIIQFFREILTLDDRLAGPRQTPDFAPQYGDTLVFGARECTIHSLSSDYDYVIAADRLSMPSVSNSVVSDIVAQ